MQCQFMEAFSSSRKSASDCRIPGGYGTADAETAGEAISAISLSFLSFFFSFSFFYITRQVSLQTWSNICHQSGLHSWLIWSPFITFHHMIDFTTFSKMSPHLNASWSRFDEVCISRVRTLLLSIFCFRCRVRYFGTGFRPSTGFRHMPLNGR